MARLLGYFIKKEGQKNVNVLVATSGDTGSAVANGFLGVEGIHVYVLYPKGKVSEIQEKQFTTLGQNITALEVDGTFDDCQALVKSAFMDKELNEHLSLTSANSINVARFLPQAFYYFYAYAQLKRAGKADNAVICVPSGNFGNITAGLFGKKMGLPVKRFIAANNRNDIFYQYLQTGKYNPRPSIATIANAMDVGDPSNFARVLDLYSGSHADISAEISGTTYTDEQIRETVKETWKEHHYLLDPHGADGKLVEVHTGLKDKKAFVAIVNYGKIIPAKDLDKIFDKFYRVENSRSLKTGGTGLGLAIAKNIINLHEGNIWATSDESGTRFQIELPVVQAHMPNTGK